MDKQQIAIEEFLPERFMYDGNYRLHTEKKMAVELCEHLLPIIASGNHFLVQMETREVEHAPNKHSLYDVYYERGKVVRYTLNISPTRYVDYVNIGRDKEAEYEKRIHDLYQNNCTLNDSNYHLSAENDRLWSRNSMLVSENLSRLKSIRVFGFVTLVLMFLLVLLAL